MELNLTINARLFLKSVSRGVVDRLLLIIIRLFEYKTGKNLLIAIPPDYLSLSSNPYAMFKVIDVVGKLESLNIVSSIEKHQRKYDDEPWLYHSYSAWSATDATGLKNSGHGQCFLSEENALWKAVSECTERHLWRYYDYSRKTIYASYDQVKHKSLNIFSLTGFSKEQFNQHESLRFSEHTKFKWVNGFSLTKRRKLLCPLQLVSLKHVNKSVNRPKKPYSEDKEPLLRWCITTGLATGTTKRSAIMAGILEIIERDAFMIAYLNKLSPPRIDLSVLERENPLVERMMQTFKRYNLELYLIELPTDFQVNVFCAVIIDRTTKGPAITIGACADFCPLDALLDAIGEAVEVRLWAKNNTNKKIDLDNIELEERIIFWSQSEQIHKLDFFLDGETRRLNLECKQVYAEKKYRDRQLDVLVGEFKDKGYELCYVDMTLPEIESAGLYSVNVVAPEMHPLYLHESVPYTSSKRLWELPKKLGYKPSSQLNTVPHPFP